MYAIQRVNMGDRPAAAIATEALRQTADKCKHRHPKASEFIVNSSYMDDEGLIPLGMDVGKFYRSFEWDVMGVPAKFSKIYYAGNKVGTYYLFQISNLY